ncbi:tight adherence pilus pseudopilin TadF [Pasteurella canis]|uniref:tight adherence pilus pseudopilin TadF n=1 Tax=Pasteurella canis TaxID=753 RepID=UPI001CBE3C2B|nr:tight adherence pilus pseudopilin TadF [Pasteurella canis]UAX43000.1 protein TadF [Pasteurella canis]
MKNLNSFFRNKKGSVTVEFVFMLMFLAFIFAFLADVIVMRSTMGKLDNASYTLVNILRERLQLYNGVATITDNEYKQMERLAKRLIYNDQNTKKEIHVVLEYWSEHNSKRIPNTISSCRPYKRLEELSYLSPKSEFNNERRIPLYQVTLCVESYSLFKSLLLNKSEQFDGLIRSSSMSVSR